MKRAWSSPGLGEGQPRTHSCSLVPELAVAAFVLLLLALYAAWCEVGLSIALAPCLTVYDTKA